MRIGNMIKDKSVAWVPVVVLWCLFLRNAAATEYAHYPSWTVSQDVLWSLPNGVLNYLEKSRLKHNYTITSQINPVYQRFDYNGDAKVDYIIYIKNLDNKKEGFLICESGTKCHILYAGKKIRDASSKSLKFYDNTNGTDFWRVYPARELDQFPESAPPPTMRWEGIDYGKSESWSVVLYWTGKEFVTYQLSD